MLKLLYCNSNTVKVNKNEKHFSGWRFNSGLPGKMNKSSTISYSIQRKGNFETKK